MENKIFKLLFNMTIVLIISAAVGTILLCLSFYLPTDRIKYNIKNSMEQLLSEGDHYTIFSGLEYTEFDNYSDANYLNAAMVDNNAKGFFTGLYGLEYENINEKIEYDSPVTILSNVFHDNSNLQYKEYGRRFWNGYEIIVKPLMTFFTYGQVRIINLCIEILLLVSIILLMCKKRLNKYVLPVVISYLLLNPITMASSMVFSGFLYCMYIPCILILIYNNKFVKNKIYYLFFMMVGIFVAYFNMNYFQLLSFAYCLIFYFLMNGFPKNNKNILFTFLVYFVCWLFGFFGMYLLKWIIYEIFTGSPLILDMVNRTLYRTSSTAYYTGPTISRFRAIYMNIKNIIINTPWMAIEIIYIIYVIKKIFNENPGKKLYKYIISKKNLLYLLFIMIILVFSRYFVFANHVYVHAWVTYRICDAVILLFNIIISEGIKTSAI